MRGGLNSGWMGAGAALFKHAGTKHKAILFKLPHLELECCAGFVVTC